MNPNRKQEPITEDELRTIVDVSHEEGVIESEERKIINNVFDFGDSVARDIMIPRIDMTLVEVNAAYDELIDIFRQEMYTRIPVYEETSDNVIGIINMKDLLLVDRTDDFNIRDFF
uniref:CBS domain-containing protein n=1 Tax=Clostridium sp. NkU-1 TaxID=1095009 RepID=UPI00325FFC5F